MTVDVTADRELCCGSGQCAFRLPEVFDQGERDGLVVLVDEHPPADLLRELAEVADRCPGRAIRVTTRD